MPDRVVTIARFASPVDAHLARARLTTAGIPAEVAQEHSASYLGGEASVELRVAETDAERAIAILTGEDGEADTPHERPRPMRAGGEAPDLPRCPVCGTTHVEVRRRPVWARIGMFLLSQLIPLPESAFGRARYRCAVCTCQWREGEDEAEIPKLG